jgi:hypothetical protein
MNDELSVDKINYLPRSWEEQRPTQLGGCLYTSTYEKSNWNKVTKINWSEAQKDLKSDKDGYCCKRHVGSKFSPTLAEETQVGLQYMNFSRLLMTQPRWVG